MAARGRNQPDPRPQRSAVARLDDEAAGKDVVQAAPDQRQDGRDHRLLTDDLKHRKREHVEGDVPAEQRIAIAERHRMEGAEPGQPVVGARQSERQPDHERDPQRQARQPPAVDGDLLAVDAAAEHDVWPDECPPGEPDIQIDEEENGEERRDENRELRVDRPEKDAVVPQLTEPEPVGVVPDGRRHHEQQADDDDEDAW
jgi:hypothetical protein